jgi:hypothetical protein
MTSLPGIVGHQRREILVSHQPVLVAATLLRDAGVRRDDAGVLVAKAAEP